MERQIDTVTSAPISAIISAYNNKDYNISIKFGDNKRLVLEIHRIKEYKIFGFSFYRKKFEAKYDEDITLIPDFTNFGEDQNLNLLAFMKFAEKGFNENPTGNFDLDILHCAVGIAGESGEVLDLVKKHIFHNKPVSKTGMVDELGDALWYQVNFMRLYGISFSDVFKANIIKLNTRYPNGRDRNKLAQPKNKSEEFKLIKDGLKLDS